MTEQVELKYHCLRLAFEALGTPASAEKMLEYARLFEAYVKEEAK